MGVLVVSDWEALEGKAFPLGDDPLQETKILVNHAKRDDVDEKEP